ncbi:YcaO-like family protein [Microbacterium stercoris]|uniref:YcaO-like family protein n=1 Tax=Microbacterium stercoris TaxID=2820289 RepID=A0A939TR07_9MICO|nr:YcaO-like family protein [Microbacterium stercoris]MBO3663646.1 YcaO-like family protein [Microbacterium stercoris]
MIPLDISATLDPATGIARAVRAFPPQSPDRPLWSVAVDIGMGERRDDQSALDITWVGAAGVRQGATFVRAAGEAVERWALLSRAPLPRADPSTPHAPAGMSWAGAPQQEDRYSGVFFDGVDRQEVGVPASAVDYPPLRDSELVDPGPSGTAAGMGFDRALQSACKETIERDAAMRGWSRPQTASRLESTPLERILAGETARLLAPVAAAGVDLRVVRLPAVGGVDVLLALAIDRARSVVGAGLGLESLAQHALLRAVQEALQIRTLLLDLRRLEGTREVALPIRREIDRARFWAGASAVRAADDWLALVPEARDPAADVAPVRDWVALLPRRTVVDLTPRLPERARELNWAVVRVFCPDLRPLRMSEALAWNAPVEPAAHTFPHPFV